MEWENFYFETLILINCNSYSIQNCLNQFKVVSFFFLRNVTHIDVYQELKLMLFFKDIVKSDLSQT